MNDIILGRSGTPSHVYPLQLKSNRRPVTEEEKGKAIQAASAAAIGDSFMVIMQECHVYKGFFLVRFCKSDNVPADSIFPYLFPFCAAHRYAHCSYIHSLVLDLQFLKVFSLPMTRSRQSRLSGQGAISLRKTSTSLCM